jgi:hypothetical protein
MLILFIGIVVFLGVHSLTTFRETRTRLIERLGPGPFKGLYSVVAIAGFVLIVWGFSLYRAEGLITIAYVAMIFLPSSSECPSSAGEPSERRCGSNTHFPSGGASIMESAIIRVTVTLAVPLLFW